MSIKESLKDLRKNEEFVKFIEEAKAFQQDQKYLDEIAEKEAFRKAAIKAHICTKLKSFLNTKDKTRFSVERQTLVLNIGALNEADRKELCHIVHEKGYICDYNDKIKRLTISPNKDAVVNAEVKEEIKEEKEDEVKEEA